MSKTGWKTVIVSSVSELSFQSGNLCIEREGEEKKIPLSQIAQIMITNERVSISICLLNELCRQGVDVVFCDAKCDPYAKVLNLEGSNGEMAGRLMDQTRWNQETKDHLWQQIVKEKIRQQRNLLEEVGITDLAEFRWCEDHVLPGDTENREGQAAGRYFKLLFGPGFRRGAPDDTNAALNYGYKILLSAIGRIICAHGYQPALGIHHHSRSNPFNLSCDFIEPFRPWVDRVVFENFGKPLTWEYKKRLIHLLQESVSFDGKEMAVENVMETCILRWLDHMNQTDVEDREGEVA